MQQAAQVAIKTPAKRRAFILGFILAFVSAASAARAADAPDDLVHRVAERETRDASARDQYTYRQTVELEELNRRGAIMGTYREVRDVVFSPSGARSEQVLGKPSNSLRRLRLTREDFEDIRNIQPFLLTLEQLFLYETKFRGEQNLDGTDYWVLQIRPRQILSGQRLFEGLLWIDQRDYSIVRSEGRAVPEVRSTNSENLFPHFTTLREKVDGKNWFPATTYGDDTLFFRDGAQRVRLIIRYTDYKRFGAESTITFQP